MDHVSCRGCMVGRHIFHSGKVLWCGKSAACSRYTLCCARPACCLYLLLRQCCKSSHAVLQVLLSLWCTHWVRGLVPLDRPTCPLACQTFAATETATSAQAFLTCRPLVAVPTSISSGGKTPFRPPFSRPKHCAKHGFEWMTRHGNPQVDMGL